MLLLRTINNYRKAKKPLKIIEQKLKNLVADSDRQRKRRAEKSAALKEFASQSEDATKKLKTFTRDSVGRPPFRGHIP